MSKNSSTWHNLYGCVAQTPDHCMDPSFFHEHFVVLTTFCLDVYTMDFSMKIGQFV